MSASMRAAAAASPERALAAGCALGHWRRGVVVVQSAAMLTSSLQGRRTVAIVAAVLALGVAAGSCGDNARPPKDPCAGHAVSGGLLGNPDCACPLTPLDPDSLESQPCGVRGLTCSAGIVSCTCEYEPLGWHCGYLPDLPDLAAPLPPPPDADFHPPPSDSGAHD